MDLSCLRLEYLGDLLHIYGNHSSLAEETYPVFCYPCFGGLVNRLLVCSRCRRAGYTSHQVLSGEGQAEQCRAEAESECTGGDPVTE